MDIQTQQAHILFFFSFQINHILTNSYIGKIINYKTKKIIMKIFYRGFVIFKENGYAWELGLSRVNEFAPQEIEGILLSVFVSKDMRGKWQRHLIYWGDRMLSPRWIRSNWWECGDVWLYYQANQGHREPRYI